LTALAAFKINDYPVLLGDLLIVGDNLVIGWTGWPIEAKTVIKELIERNRVAAFTYDSLKSYLDSLDESTKDHLSLVGYVIEHGKVFTFAWGWNRHVFETPTLGRIVVAGIGTDDLEHLFRERLLGELTANMDPGPLGMAVAYSLTLSGYLIQSETDTLHSLRCHYGGGYEIAISNQQGKFTKLDDITYLFWNAEVNEVNKENLHVELTPYMVLRYSYVNDILMIRRACLGNHCAMDGQMCTVELSIDKLPYLVPPVYADLKPQDRLELQDSLGQEIWEVNSRFLGNYVLIRRPGQGLLVRTSIECGGDPSIQFLQSDNKLVMTCEPDFLKETMLAIAKPPKSNGT
jgi:hypothetical protein